MAHSIMGGLLSDRLGRLMLSISTVFFFNFSYLFSSLTPSTLTPFPSPLSFLPLTPSPIVESISLLGTLSTWINLCPPLLVILVFFISYFPSYPVTVVPVEHGVVIFHDADE